ncbi:MAG: hypothetical protein EA425_13685 [Puniceicoccaceae bacterium]|nr:MAG: hypothetical protein EA425_13685 [Puniceicoccaceae bacterium]
MKAALFPLAGFLALAIVLPLWGESAPSTIVASGPLDQVLYFDSYDALYLDFDDDGYDDAVIEAWSWEWDEDPEFGSDGEVVPVLEIGDTNGRFAYVYPDQPWPEEWLVRRLASGALIGPGLPFSEQWGWGTLQEEDMGEWLPGDRGFVGFRFVAEQTGATHFGWIEIELDSSREFAVVLQWAYESTPDTPIFAGDAGAGVEPPDQPDITDLRLQFSFEQSIGPDGESWIAFVFLSTLDAGFQDRVTLRSPGGQLRGYLNHPEGVTSSSVRLGSFAQIRALINGSWTLEFQSGSGEVVYDLEINADGFEPAGLPEFDLLAPLPGQILPFDDFNAAWTQPSVPWLSVRVRLDTVDRSTGTPRFNFLFNENLPSGATSYRPVMPLIDDEYRLSVTYSRSALPTPGLVVGEPTLSGQPAAFTFGANPALGSGVRQVLFTLSDEAPPPLTGIEGWRAAHFTAAQLADPAISGPAAVPARDGLTNTEKYAFRLSPFDFDPAVLPRIEAGAGGSGPRFVFTLRNDDPDLTHRVEGSADGHTWRHNDDGAGPDWFVIQVEDNGDGSSTVTAALTAAAPANGLIIRLRLLLTGGE